MLTYYRAVLERALKLTRPWLGSRLAWSGSVLAAVFGSAISVWFKGWQSLADQVVMPLPGLAGFILAWVVIFLTSCARAPWLLSKENAEQHEAEMKEKDKERKGAIREAESQKTRDAKTISDLRQKLEARPIDPQLILGSETTAIHKGFYVRNGGPSQDAFNIKLRDVRSVSLILRSEELVCVEAGKTAPFRLIAFPAEGKGGSVVLGVLGGAINAFLEDLAAAEGVSGFKGVPFSAEIEYSDASGQRYLSCSEVTWKPGREGFSIKLRGISKSS